jgi:antitoxin CcdA
MKRSPISPAKRKAVNLSLDLDVVTQAKELGINFSRVCERGLLAEIASARGDRWLRENSGALEAWNAWIDEHGLPLEEYRKF